MPKEFTCEECNATFLGRPSQRRRFCSAHCKMVAQSRRLIAEGRRYQPRKPRRGDEIPCDVCGNSFYRGPGEIARNRRYCSLRCKNVGQTAEPVVKACGTCGKELRLKPSQAAIQFCSKACEAARRTLRPLDRLHNGRPVRLDNKGYVMVWEPEHPNRAFRGWQYEHRLVVEQRIGRLLRSDEHVHHLSGVKDDNRSENLQILGQAEHAALSSREYHDQVRRDLEELEAYRRRYGPLKE